jgi:hypothetical protein
LDPYKNQELKSLLAASVILTLNCNVSPTFPVVGAEIQLQVAALVFVAVKPTMPNRVTVNTDTVASAENARFALAFIISTFFAAAAAGLKTM